VSDNVAQLLLPQEEQDKCKDYRHRVHREHRGKQEDTPHAFLVFLSDLCALCGKFMILVFRILFELIYTVFIRG
jgi:hypothetical protein